jgi:hypothetical protein
MFIGLDELSRRLPGSAGAVNSNGHSLDALDRSARQERTKRCLHGAALREDARRLVDVRLQCDALTSCVARTRVERGADRRHVGLARPGRGRLMLNRVGEDIVAFHGASLVRADGQPAR